MLGTDRCVCGAMVDYEINVGRDGTHREAACHQCGADLQFDQPIPGGARLDILRTGPPQACEHSERRRPGARVPSSPN